MVIVCDLGSWFEEAFSGVPCSPEARAYVVSVFKQYGLRNDTDLSKRSVVLEYVEAVSRSDFETYRRLGDWVMWRTTVLPDKETFELEQTFGRLSYLACDRILRKQWHLYEELADEMPRITLQASSVIKKKT